MASKKKLRKRLKYYVRKIESYQENIIRQRNTINSLYENIGVLLEGTDKNRFLQLRIPKTQKEIEDDAYMNKDFIAGYDPNAKEKHAIHDAYSKPKDAVPGEKFKYEELEKRTCQPTQVNPEKEADPVAHLRIPDYRTMNDRTITFKPISRNQTDGFKNRSGDELNIGDWVDLFPNPGGFPKKIKSFFVDPDEAFPGIMALTDYGDSYNIDYLTPNIKYNELKKEEEKKEGAVPEAGQ